MKSLALVGLLAAVALAGCTDGSGIEYEVPPMDAEGRYVIEMAHNRFMPQNAEVPVGATVLWKWIDGNHNVVSEDGLWQQGTVSQDDFEVVMTTEMLGENYYFCAPHESLGMFGHLKVVEELDAMDGMDESDA